MSTQLLASKHFKAVCPYDTVKLSTMKKISFKGRKGANAAGISEELCFEAVSVTRQDNMEILVRETVPSFLKARRAIGYEWKEAFERFTTLLDDTLTEKFDDIVTSDFNTNALKTEANFKKAIRKLVDAALLRANVRDDIIELMQTGCKKPANKTPSEHYERLEELKKCCVWTQGLGKIPSDEDVKVYFWRSMPAAMQTSAQLRGLNAGSSIEELKEHLNAANEDWVRKNPEKVRARKEGDGQSTQSGSRRKKTRYDYSQTNNGNGNRRGHQGRGSRYGGAANRTRFDAPCPHHPDGNHTWGQCFNNPDGANFRSRSNSGRGRGGRGHYGGRGGRGGRGSDASQGNSGNHDSHHVSQGSSSSQGNQNTGGTNGPPAVINASETHHVEMAGANNNTWGDNNSHASSSLFSRAPLGSRRG